MCKGRKQRIILHKRVQNLKIKKKYLTHIHLFVGFNAYTDVIKLKTNFHISFSIASCTLCESGVEHKMCKVREGQHGNG